MRSGSFLLLFITLSFSAVCAEFGSELITASTIRRAEHIPYCAIDGNPQTRWSSDTPAPSEYLQIDFGESVPITGMRIVWEFAYAVEYKLLTSEDGEQWTTIFHQTEGKGETENLTGLKGQGRYLKIDFLRQGPHALYSIWEIKFTNPKARNALKAQVDALNEKRRIQIEKERVELAAKLSALEFEDIIYTTREIHDDGHWYANIAYYAADDQKMTYKKGGGLYKLNIPTGTVTALLEDEEGTFRDPAVHHDGSTIVFAWRKGGTRQFHLYTIQADGTELTQLTSSEFDDIEPAWLPDGDIVFTSTRSRRWVNCWLTQVATIHRCSPDGTNIRPLSANLEHDNTPWPLHDGRILYMRWEYVDRSQVDYHHLWTMNPDGTNQTVYFGNMHPRGVFIDAKPIPGSDEVVMINSPGHGAKEHAGNVAIVTPKKGPDELASIKTISKGNHRDPYALSTDMFMAAHKNTIVVLNRNGTSKQLHQLGPDEGIRELHEPRPLIARKKEHIIPPRSNYAKHTGTLVLADAHVGRKMDGIAPGDVKSLLVVETLPKPINYTGGMDPISYGGTFTLERILGTVPVEADGSAHIELPANRALFFVAQDENGDAIKRMQSFVTVMPGETTSCVGCHEQRTQTMMNPGQQKLLALQRPPSKIKPIPDIPEVFDFPRDIQPILDKHCLKCHDYTKHGDHGPRKGNMILSGDHGPMFSHSYVNLTLRKQIADGRDQAISNYAPRTLGAVASPLVKKAKNGHHGVKMSEHEINMLTYWIESAAAYPGTYGAMGGGAIGAYYENTLQEVDFEWPESKAAAEVIQNRCNECHNDTGGLPKMLADENNLSFWRPDWNDNRLLRNRHMIFNLTRPEQSLALLAPLSKNAGGYGICTPEGGAPVIANTDDPGYQAILSMCVAGKNRMAEIKRFDMPGFRPPAAYVREMKRYGVLPKDLPDDAVVDPYKTDYDYWRSFEQEIALDHEVYAKK